MYTPKLVKNIVNSIKPLSTLGKFIIIPLLLVSAAGFVELIVGEPYLMIPTAVFAIAYETSD